MGIQLPPQPARSTLIERALPPAQGWSGMITGPWMDWLRQVVTRVQQASTTLKTVSLTGQSAAIAATPVPMGALATGLYRVSTYLHVTRAATTSSSVAVKIGWNDGMALVGIGTALSLNLTTATASNTWVIHVTGSSPITYETTYASVGAVTMQYALYLTVESVG